MPCSTPRMASSHPSTHRRVDKAGKTYHVAASSRRQPEIDPGALRYARAAALTFFVVAIAEGWRVVSGNPWPGFEVQHVSAVSVGLFVLWTATGAMLLLRRRGPRLAMLAFELSFVGTAAMVPHAFVTRIGGSIAGLLFLPIAVGAALMLKRAWPSQLLDELRHGRRLAHYEENAAIDPIYGRPDVPRP